MKEAFVKKVHRIDTGIDKKRMLRKDSDTLKVMENVFDTPTLKSLYNLSKKGLIQAMGGSISTGKEANVFLADGEEGEIAVKIYRISSSTFNTMEDYILGDPRFANIGHKKHDIIFAWTRKEFRNLERARNAGVRVPTPITTERNILLMEFMGEKGNSYPLLKDTALENEEAQRIFDTVVAYMRTLYLDASLVHADLSEYNIMVNPQDMTPILIDMGQSVILEHAHANDFLRRDIQNIVRFFKRFGVKASPNELYSFIRTKEEIK